ncbi:MAG TPA: serine/threonine-protein kinase [Anaerovoracaceae bacterium]|nr:serine/threonine-protein kinase [Anaerovoracaceae bacterium]
MSKADAFQAWCREQTQTALAPQFLYDEEHRVTGIVKRVSLSLVPVYEVLRQIESPVLPRILDIREQEGALLITEEYIEGKSLRYLLDEEGAQDDAFVIRAAKDILEALSILHNRIPPIIHRDIKPENIILRDNGRFVLIDFDAARGYSEVAQTDTVNLGTHGYAAPEQYGFAQTDARADIYSFGILLYELRMGKPYSLGAACDGSLEKIIRRCTQFEAKNRYRSAKEADIALGKIGKRKLRMVRALVAGTVGVAALCVVFFLLHKLSAPFRWGTDAIAPTPSAPVQAVAQPLVISSEEGIPCTCILEDPAAKNSGAIYLPENIYDFVPGETRVLMLDFRLPRIESGCEAEAHDEPEYTYFLRDWRPMGTNAGGDTITEDTVTGNTLTIREPGQYRIAFHTKYHGQGYGGNYALDVLTESDGMQFAASGAIIPCTCTLEHPLTPEERTRYLPESMIALPHGETLVKTLEVRPIRNADNCKAEVHDEPQYTFSFDQYVPPAGQEELAGTIGADIVQGDQIAISAPGKYYVWFETKYHGEGFRAGYTFWVDDAP